jgi:hypothetical protein
MKSREASMHRVWPVLLVALAVLAAAPTDPAESFHYFQNAFPIGSDAGQSCTIIYASDGKTALAGNNEDWKSPFGTIWLLPAENGKFGRVYFGWRSNDVTIPQCGMNEQDRAPVKRIIMDS